ncbi:MAG: tRNA(Met) cytidine acetyltransferase [Gammaproteobacteria bacterium]|nr:tRNA(Met) cytidine acetyltransferase [Gammaproteobacteria bacterium]
MGPLGGADDRRLLLVVGSEAWGEQWVCAQLAAHHRDDVLWLASSSTCFDHVTTTRQVFRLLGREFRAVVVNVHQGLHPDAFAAAVGTLRGGGDCVVLAPPMADWDAFVDPDKARFAAYPRAASGTHNRFLLRLRSLWHDDHAVSIVEESDDDTETVRLRVAPDDCRELALTDEQSRVVGQVLRVASGHARRPLVLLADRGRGKSTVLGVAAAQLLQRGECLVTVVASSHAAAAVLFRHAIGADSADPRAVGEHRVGEGRLCFRLPQDIAEAKGGAPGIVLVDEAAAIPMVLLRRLLRYANRVVFATTVHGYEGSGRGFVLRFARVLDEAMPQWRETRLTDPVRWRSGDALERLLNRSLMLDVDLDDIGPPAAFDVGPLSLDRLSADELLLRRVFGLLVNAHYQTRPSDLRQLLDNPDVSLWVARAGTDLLGVVLLDAEGDIDADMAARILSGERRPRGHLLPQSLAVHAGIDAILRQRVLRVQRIAVHPDARRRGVGRALLEAVSAWAGTAGFDHLGCAFAADVGLLGFWRQCGFAVARVGLRVDPASGSHSLFMLRGLSAAGRVVAQQAAGGFQHGLPWSLGMALRDLDSRLAVSLLRGRDNADIVLDGADREILTRLVAGTRQLLTADQLLWRALVLMATTDQSDDALAPGIAWLLQGQDVQTVCQRFDIEGRAPLEQALRASLSVLTRG